MDRGSASGFPPHHRRGGGVSSQHSPLPCDWHACRRFRPGKLLDRLIIELFAKSFPPGRRIPAAKASMALATAAISAAPATCERPRPRRPFNHGSRLLAPHQRPKMVVCSRRGAAIFARAGRHWSEANARGVASRRGILSLLVTPVAASLLPARADVIDEQGSSSLVAQVRRIPCGVFPSLTGGCPCYPRG